LTIPFVSLWLSADPKAPNHECCFYTNATLFIIDFRYSRSWPGFGQTRHPGQGGRFGQGLIVRPEQLPEAIVTNLPIRANTEVIGRQNSGKLTQVSIHQRKSADATIGSEMGMRYEASRKNAILKDFSVYISANNFNYIKFRINIYSVRNHMPDSLLFGKQIFETVENFRTGWIKTDLESRQINVKDEFIITIQWIESRMDKKENPLTILPVAMTPFSKNCYVRIASQDKWKRMGMNLSCFVTVEY
jgi:hypothetical protein